MLEKPIRKISLRARGWAFLAIGTVALVVLTQRRLDLALAQSPSSDPAETEKSGASSKKSIKRDQKIGPTKTKIVKDEVRTQEGHQAGTGVAIFMGITGGNFTLSADDPKIESNKTGFYLAGKSLCSIYSDNWVTDIGLGWFYGELQSSGPGTDEKPPPEEGVEFTPGPVRIALNAGLFELAPRFRITENWQIGPMIDVFFSTEDTSFSGRYQDLKSPTQVSALVGAQLMYGVPKKQADWRAGLEYMTDVSIEGRQLQFISATLQFGLPLVSPDTIYQEREILTERQRIEMIEKRRLDRKVVVKEVVKFVFEKQQIMFLKGGATLHIDSQSFLLELAGILKNNASQYDDLTIEGHVGPDTPFALAKRLSEGRAESVEAALVSAGVDQAKVRTVGFGATKPIRPGLPSERDERIVLGFAGIKDIRAFSSAINGIRKQFHIPETCTAEDGCK